MASLGKGDLPGGDPAQRVRLTGACQVPVVLPGDRVAGILIGPCLRR